VAGYIFYHRIEKIKEKKNNKPFIFILAGGLLISIWIVFLQSVFAGEFVQGFFGYRSVFIMLSSICFFLLVLINKERVMKKPVTRVVRIVTPYFFGIYLSHLMFYNILVKEFNILKLNGAYGVPLLTLGVLLVTFIFCFI
jgi:surface polysaccharide O-acyltransferase-like enzyme